MLDLFSVLVGLAILGAATLLVLSVLKLVLGCILWPLKLGFILLKVVVGLVLVAIVGVLVSPLIAIVVPLILLLLLALPLLALGTLLSFWWL